MNKYNLNSLSNQDQALKDQFGYKYDYLKYKYPQTSTLPKKEVNTMIDVIYNNGNTLDEAEPYLENYIKTKEPEWKLKYFGPSTLPNNQTWMMQIRAQSDMEQRQNLMKAQAEIQNRLNNYNNKGFYLTGDQWKDVGGAVLDGLHSGMETAVNSLTQGGYYWLDNNYDNEATKRRERLRQEAELAGVEDWYNKAQTMADWGGRGVAYYGISKPLKAYTDKKWEEFKMINELVHHYLNKSLTQVYGKL